MLRKSVIFSMCFIALLISSLFFTSGAVFADEITDSIEEAKGFEKEHFVKMMAFIDNNFDENTEMMGSGDIVEKEANEMRALLISKKQNGETEEIVMVKEDGKWKMFLDNPFA